MDLDVIDITLDGNTPSSSTGYEYLINTSTIKPRGTDSRKAINTAGDNYHQLEMELNQIGADGLSGHNSTGHNKPATTYGGNSSGGGNGSGSSGGGGFFSTISDMFGGVASDPNNPNTQSNVRIPMNTAEWDKENIRNSGHQPANNQSRPSATSSERSNRKKKRMMLRELKRLEEINPEVYKLSVSEDSTIEDIEDEYDMFNEEHSQQNSLKMIRNAFKGTVSAIEWGNASIDPFGWQLTGISDAVTETLPDYELMFVQLQKSYKDFNIPIEMQILGNFVQAAVVIHCTNSVLSQMMNNDPAFTPAVASDPGVKHAVKAATARQLNSYGAPPPAPIETNTRPRTYDPNPMPGKPQQPQTNPIFSSRPDLEAAVGQRQPVVIPNNRMNESGVSLSSHAPYQATTSSYPQQSYPPQQYLADKQPLVRPEMKGPSNEIEIETMLAGIKLAKPLVQQPLVQQPLVQPPIQTDHMMEFVDIDNLSQISTNSDGPRSRRRKRSERVNVMTIDV